MATEVLRLNQFDCGILKPLDLVIHERECVCLSGASGSGKSRLLRAIADLDPHGGEAVLRGHAQSAIPAPQWRRRVALLPAESQWWAETVGEHLPKAPAAADLRALDLPAEATSWNVARLSSGEKQRLALLRVVSLSPEVLLLDEPTANLDSDNAARVERWLLRLVREQRLAALWVSHDPAQIERVADARLRIREGEAQWS
ncbi:hypothetical protein CAI21_08140 [Alkalilimnicola ehrlichii]|uniref:ABC transporter domain-containing protein n=1 Tax=Alkalilimnicola ehrlichii TaxID=351052 RepID=A0A3E0WZP6_9GAMM|nr:ATP-binding cassette domain-containing protein [Alkalilimnicola ehrlichii]RFA30148.1 hypothetical protein CAI21_08140 [Alkalilimnicola ehrlichii]RFA37496.1 hypothetical protein CAL65_09485 [Alkalilimnicola ehrlichii]